MNDSDLTRYINRDPRCHLAVLDDCGQGDYCWLYAMHVDGEPAYWDMLPRCRKCEHWVETNQPEHCTWCGETVFAILHRRLDGTVTPACKPCYKDGLDSQKYTGPSLSERYFWEKKYEVLPMRRRPVYVQGRDHDLSRGLS